MIIESELKNELSEIFEPLIAEKLTKILIKILERTSSHETRLDRIEKILEQVAIEQKKLAKSQEELTQAQKRTELRVEELAKSQEELTQAQKRTELRVEELAKSQEELTQAQKRTELRVEELTQAQKRTELRVEELAKSQEELAQAQKRTEYEISNLAKQVGGLSHSVGYNLEDKTYPALPKILKEEFNFSEVSRLKRINLRYDDKNYDEINIYGDGKLKGETIYIVGECKINLSKNDIKRYLEMCERVEEKLKSQIFKIIITSHCAPEVEDFAKENNIPIIYSYQLQ